MLHAREWLDEREFDTPLEVLKHMKQTGVNGLRKPFLGKEWFRSFEEKYYGLHATNNKVRLTYNPITIIAKKRTYV